MRALLFVSLILCLFCAGCLNFMRGPETSIQKVTEGVDERGEPYRTVETKHASSGSYRGMDAAKVNFGATHINSTGASTGKTEQESEEGEASMSPLYIIGGLVIAGGVIVAWFTGSLGLGVICFVAGSAVIAVGRFLDKYPWAILFPLAAAGVDLVYKLWLGKQAELTLGVVTPEIEADEHGEEIKDRIATRAGRHRRKVKDMITRIKRKRL